MRFQVLPGFRDFFPETLAVRRHVEGAWHAASRAFGFEEIDGPVLEPLELFTRKSGDEIAGQLYHFTDKGGREVALRPEFTPSLARMVAARAGGLPKPIKWYALPEFYRYEKPQRGRLRAFQQWNCDVIGAPEAAADAEAIAVALDALCRLGLSEADVRVHVGDRRVLNRLLESLDVGAEQAPGVMAALDKWDRDPEARKQLELELGPARAGQIAAWCAQYPLESAPELAEVCAAAEDHGVGGFLQPDFRIVRGLAYYTGPVWEIFDCAGALRAVAGGGRYDDLIAASGGPELAALGFGMGDVVLTEILRERGLLPETPARIEVAVIPVGDEMAGPARRVAARLRARGQAAEAPYTAARLNKALKAADAAGARRAVIVGPDEWAAGEVMVRDLASREERRVKLDDLD